jgi:hypothetical protein
MKKRPKIRKKASRKEQVIVLKDGAGNYYEIPRARLERSKVSPARKKRLKAALMSPPTTYTYIKKSWIPGSVAAPRFKGGRRLHYAGFYLRSRRSS